MDVNDYLGSFAQENVSFATQVIRTSVVGDNYWKVMVFVEDDHYVDASSTDWTPVPGSTTIKGLTVTAEDYASFTNGLLQSWLYDLFISGFTGDCILIACGESVGTDDDKHAAFITKMTEAYELLKPYAYHKTVCVAADSTNVPDADICVALASLCKPDRSLLSAAPYFPCLTATPASDPLVSALKTANVDAFMGWHTDSTRNVALFSLGIALANYNGSGTPVGSQIDQLATSNITASQGGINPSKGTKTLMEEANVQYFKTVGDNTGNVAAVGYKTILGEVVGANWIVAYIAYMVKVDVAKAMTSIGFYKNAASYGQILTMLGNRLNGFINSGRLTNVTITAPAFGAIDTAADEIMIPNAWVGTYGDIVRKVTITGVLYI